MEKHPYFRLKKMVDQIQTELKQMEEGTDFSNVPVFNRDGTHSDTDIQFDAGAIIWAFNVIRAIRAAGGGKT